MTRLISAILFAALAMTISAQAGPIEYPWCAEYGGSRGGGANCGFVTLEQCRWALSGNGGMCRENMFYRGVAYAPEVVVRPRVSKKRHRHVY